MRGRRLLRAILSTALAAAWLPGCGEELGPAAEAEGVPPAELSIAGTYQVDGVTVEEGSGAERKISGTVILAEDGDRYTATFNLSTVFPSPGGSVRSDVIGNGEGVLKAGAFEGTAETQIVAAAIPGVDPKFAFIPRRVSTRIVSTTVGRIEEDGTLTIEIKSIPAEGEIYSATRTTLQGFRSIAREPSGSLPDVAAPPR